MKGWRRSQTGDYSGIEKWKKLGERGQRSENQAGGLNKGDGGREREDREDRRQRTRTGSGRGPSEGRSMLDVWGMKKKRKRR